MRLRLAVLLFLAAPSAFLHALRSDPTGTPPRDRQSPLGPKGSRKARDAPGVGDARGVSGKPTAS